MSATRYYIQAITFWGSVNKLKIHLSSVSDNEEGAEMPVPIAIKEGLEIVKYSS